MINYQGEEFTETEFYGREILEAIQLTNKFPISKKKLTSSLEKMIHEQFDLIDKEELEDYIKAKKYVETLTEDEVVWSEELTEWSSSNGVHCSWFKIHKNSSWDVSSTGCFIEVDVDSFELKI